jgi:hypothetical protein
VIEGIVGALNKLEDHYSITWSLELTGGGDVSGEGSGDGEKISLDEAIEKAVGLND